VQLGLFLGCVRCHSSAELFFLLNFFVVEWGLFNLAVGYLLVCRVGSFNLRKTQHVLVLGAGILLMSLMLAHAFGQLHGGL
jgi:ABC-type tungstate transport system substrate-binding protein